MNFYSVLVDSDDEETPQVVSKQTIKPRQKILKKALKIPNLHLEIIVLLLPLKLLTQNLAQKIKVFIQNFAFSYFILFYFLFFYSCY